MLRFYQMGTAILTKQPCISGTIEYLILLQTIPFCGQFITIEDTGFPGIQFLAAILTSRSTIEQRSTIGRLNHKVDFLTFRTFLISSGPIIKRIDFSIESQLCQQEVDYRLRDSSLIHSSIGAMLIRKIRQRLLQLTEDKAEHLAPFALRTEVDIGKRSHGNARSRLIDGRLARRQNHGNPAKKLHRLVIHHSSDGTHLCLKLVFLIHREQIRLVIDDIKRLIRLSYHLIEMTPHSIERVFLLAMLYKVYVLIERRYGMVVDFRRRTIHGIPVELLLRMLIRTRREYHNSPQHEDPNANT